MKKETIFYLVYYLCLIAFSMILILVVDKRPNEMLGSALWGGILYAVLTYAPMAYINRKLSSLKNETDRTTARFFINWIVLNVFVLLASGWGGEVSIWLALQGIFILSFTIATLVRNIIPSLRDNHTV